jgi:hypothetical protein
MAVRRGFLVTGMSATGFVLRGSIGISRDLCAGQAVSRKSGLDKILYFGRGRFRREIRRYRESDIGVGGKGAVGNRNLQNISRKRGRADCSGVLALACEPHHHRRPAGCAPRPAPPAVGPGTFPSLGTDTCKERQRRIACCNYPVAIRCKLGQEDGATSKE